MAEIIENKETLHAFNLIDRHKDKREDFIGFLRDSESYREEHPKFKLGDIIEFYGGYDDDVLFRSEILGFNTDEEIYVLWDCYWFPIKDEKIRQIKLIN